MVFENGACGSLITSQCPGKNSAAAAEWFREEGISLLRWFWWGKRTQEVWRGSCCSLGNAGCVLSGPVTAVCLFGDGWEEWRSSLGGPGVVPDAEGSWRGGHHPESGSRTALTSHKEQTGNSED